MGRRLFVDGHRWKPSSWLDALQGVWLGLWLPDNTVNVQLHDHREGLQRMQRKQDVHGQHRPVASRARSQTSLGPSGYAALCDDARLQSEGGSTARERCVAMISGSFSGSRPPHSSGGLTLGMSSERRRGVTIGIASSTHIAALSPAANACSASAHDEFAGAPHSPDRQDRASGGFGTGHRAHWRAA